MSDERFHVFYVWAYGMEPRHEEYDSEEEVLAVVKKALEPDSPYYSFRVIYGQQLEFEPTEVVVAYRVKPT